MPKLCPHCHKSSEFKAVISHPGVVNLSTAQDTIVSEAPKFVYEVRACNACGATVTNDTLIEADYCEDTKVLYPVTELLEFQGRKLSKPAHALATRAELQGLSQHDLIAKLLELEQKAGAAPAPAKAPQETAAASEAE